MCMLHHGVAAGLLKSVSPTTQELEDVDLRVLPSCVSRKQHVVYKTSHVNVVLFTSWFVFSFYLNSRARNLQLWLCNFFQYQKTLCLISCLRVFKLLSLCVRAYWGGGRNGHCVPVCWITFHQTGSAPPGLPPPPLFSDKNDFKLCFYLLSSPVTYLVLKINSLAMTSLWVRHPGEQFDCRAFPPAWQSDALSSQPSHLKAAWA